VLGPLVGWGLAVAASLLLGALAAVSLRLRPRLAAAVTALGGGLLLAAVAFELMPEADERAGAPLTSAGLVAGTLLFVAGDAWLAREPGRRRLRRAMHGARAGRPMDHSEAARGESIAAGLVVDGVPESVALGLTIVEGRMGLALLAGILVGNLVEAYGAAQPIVAGGHTRRFAVTLLGAIGAALCLAVVLGGTLLEGARPELVGTAQALAAGALLAVISISIVPHAFAEVSREVATATVAGFVAGYLLSL
jgi:ZIP family zinc transporter